MNRLILHGLRREGSSWKPSSKLVQVLKVATWWYSNTLNTQINLCFVHTWHTVPCMDKVQHPAALTDSVRVAGWRRHLFFCKGRPRRGLSRGLFDLFVSAVHTLAHFVTRSWLLQIVQQLRVCILLLCLGVTTFHLSLFLSVSGLCKNACRGDPGVSVINAIAAPSLAASFSCTWCSIKLCLLIVSAAGVHGKSRVSMCCSCTYLCTVDTVDVCLLPQHCELFWQ